MSANKTHTAQQFSPWSIVRTIWKGKWTILAIWAIVSIAGLVSVQFLPTIYTANALIVVDSQKIPERFVTSTVSTDLQDRIASISQQILSSTELNKIITDFGLYKKERSSMVQEEIIDKMKKDIEIKVDKAAGYTKNRPGAFRVIYQGSNASVVAQVANKVALLFINENLKNRSLQAEGTSEFLDSQLQESKRTLDALEASIGKYKIQHNGELPQQEGALGTTMARLQGELNAARDAISRGSDTKLVQQSNLSTAEATLLALQEQAAAAAAAAAASVPAVAVPGRPAADPAAAGPRTAAAPRRSDTLRAQLQAARVRWTDDYPDVRRLLLDLARAEETERQQDEAATRAALAAKLADQAKPLEAGAPNTAPSTAPNTVRESPQMGQLRDRMQTLKVEMELTTRDVEKRKANESRLLASINDIQARIEKLPLREQEFSILMRDYAITKGSYQQLLGNKLSAEMSKDMELRQKSERFTVVDPATVPERPSKPDRPKLSGIISGIGMLFGLGLAFLVELRRDVFLGEWELPGDVVVLGTLPRMDDYAAAAAPAPPGGSRRFFSKRTLVGSALLGALATAAAGFYLRNHS